MKLWYTWFKYVGYKIGGKIVKWYLPSFQSMDATFFEKEKMLFAEPKKNAYLEEMFVAVFVLLCFSYEIIV